MDSNPPDIKIKWGEDTQIETVKSSDRVLVDPNLFRNQVQTDSNLCVYLVMAAQLQLSPRDPVLLPHSARIVIESPGGLKGVAEVLRHELGTPRASNFQLRGLLEDRTTPASKKVVRLSEYQLDDESRPHALNRMIDEGLLPSFRLNNENHAVLGIGRSQDGGEIIAWDALTGTGNPRLRRIPMDREDLEFIAAIEIDPEFKS